MDWDSSLIRMSGKYRLLILLIGWALAQSVSGTQIIVGNLGFEKIPTNENRRVVGTWFLKVLDCTRSIEAVGDHYFMVSRCRDKREDGTGLPIRKMSATLYEGQTTTWSYEIVENGSLVMRSRRGAEMIGEPHTALWP